jgi:uncharacterized protein YndB with AHSA1/START domain
MATATTRTIKKSIDINASKERVWKVLLDDQYTRQWYNAFSEGSHAETDWQVGSEAKFIDNSGSGIVAKIVTNRPYEELSMTFTGLVDKGKAVYEGSEVEGFKDKFETYRLSERNGKTRLDISTEMSEEYYETMDKSWETALEHLKRLAENG